MQHISQSDFDTLVAGGEVAGRNNDGVSVWRLADGRYVKVFRRGRGLSTNLVRPYAVRFQRAAAELSKRGFVTISVTDVLRIGTMRRHAVIYTGLAGVPIRAELKDHPEKNESLLPAVASFYADLHRSGIYFRANHFGNLLVQPEGGVGLIDIGEAHFRRGPLRSALRARNFKPPLRYDIDRNAIEALGASRFISLYLGAAALSESARGAFLHHLSKIDPLFRNIVGEYAIQRLDEVSA